MIVKNLLAVGAIATLASAASAADVSKADWKINGVMRMDAVQTTKETKPGTGDKSTTKSSSVALQRTQLGLTGTQGAVSLHLHYNLEGSDATEKNTLWDAYVSNKLNDMITLSFGKLNALSQSIENSYEVQDLYITSMAYGYNVVNAAGGQVTANFGDHSLSLQILQGVSTVGTNSFDSKGGLTTSIQYAGDINKMIKPVLTYSMVKTASSKAYVKDASGKDTAVVAANYGNGYQNQLGAGVAVDVAGAKIDLEYDSVTMIKQKDDEASKNSTVNSIVAQVKYAVADFTPFLKITSDTKKLGADEGLGDVTGMKFALGTEYAMAPGFRLHAFYMSDATSKKAAGSTTDKETTTGFNMGVTASL